MLKRSYKNFDEMFYKINREFLLHPELFDYVRSAIGYKEDVTLCANNFDCSLNIGDFGYRLNKWTSYSKQMVDTDKFKAFKEEIEITNSTCIMFDFGCKDSMLCVIFKRHDMRSRFKTCDVYFKSAELFRHFAVDLVLLSVFLKSVPNINLKEINIHISQTFISATYLNAFIDYFDLGVEELNQDHAFVKALVNAKKKYFSDKDNLSNYESLLRMQKLYFEMYEVPNIRVIDLELENKQ